VKKLHDAEPEVSWFETPLIVDNKAGWHTCLAGESRIAAELRPAAYGMVSGRSLLARIRLRSRSMTRRLGY
jgi:hypothetical protein